MRSFRVARPGNLEVCATLRPMNIRPLSVYSNARLIDERDSTVELDARWQYRLSRRSGAVNRIERNCPDLGRPGGNPTRQGVGHSLASIWL
jgi:hypothetical protein